jgi:hypothetical protein
MSKSTALRAVKARQMQAVTRRQKRAELLPWESLPITPRDAAHLASRMERKARHAEMQKRVKS